MNIEDAAQLEAYLREKGYLGPKEAFQIRVLAGGVSNRTVLVKREQGADVVIKQALDKLRVEADWFSDPARIHREAEGMRLLGSILPAGMVPAQVFEDEAYHLLGMDAVPEPHTNWKQDLLQGWIAPGIVEQFGQLLGWMHSGFEVNDYPAGGAIRGREFFESLRLEPYYLFTARRVPAAAEFLHGLVDETREQQLTLVHGDYSPKNILVYDGRLVLLDHEVIHIGDPAFDVGFSMAHLLSKARHLPAYRNDLLEAARLYWTTYQALIRETAWFEDLEARAVRHTLGCLLARVAGRSPLEYLSDEERSRQQSRVLSLVAAPTRHMPELIADFPEGM